MFAFVEKELARFGSDARETFEVSFSDGSRYCNRRGPQDFAVRFRTRAAELAVAAFGHVGLLDAYFDGDVDVDGDLRAAMRVGMQSGFDSPNALVAQRNRWLELSRSNGTHEQARENARAHYALGTDFYRLWLDDPLMMYTCAYWAPGTRTLEHAQANKIDHVCRKLRLTARRARRRHRLRLRRIHVPRRGRMRRRRSPGVNTTPEQVVAVRRLDRASAGSASRLTCASRRDMRDAFAAIRQGRVDRRAGTRRPRPARATSIRATRIS